MASEFAAEMIETAKAIAAPGKGILASDESVGTIGKRFKPIDVENNEENRRIYRQLLYSTPGLGEHISAAIMFEETLFHKADDGTPFPEFCRKQGIIPGIKVDKGTKNLHGTDGETTTQGLDDLDKRCQQYYAQGARFAKWRAVIHIKESGAPTESAIQDNVRGLARYASICQANGLMPMVEPEVLMDGTHSLERAAEVTRKVLAAQYKALADYNVILEATLLKPNMVRGGSEYTGQCSHDDIAKATMRVVQETVPPAVPGIMFLSGGMSEEDATVCLNKMNQLDTVKPWSVSFSYGRALQQSVLAAWRGKNENIEQAKKQLMIRAKANGLACLGKYQGEAATSEAAKESLHVKNYTY